MRKDISMTYSLGSKSLRNLRTVDPRLQAVVKLAIQYSTVDFAVHEGARSVAAQRENIKKGVSWTMRSKHIIRDGQKFARAVDLVPYINGMVRWEWEACFKVAVAMRRAAEELGVPLEWGGSWSMLTGTREHPRELNRRYVVARLKAGKKAQPDGPHFQLPDGFK